MKYLLLLFISLLLNNINLDAQTSDLTINPKFSRYKDFIDYRVFTYNGQEYNSYMVNTIGTYYYFGFSDYTGYTNDSTEFYLAFDTYCDWCGTLDPNYRLKEDSLKIWYKSVFNNEAYTLLYDFNFQPGDGYYISSPDYYLTVVATDSIFLNNLTRKRIIFDTITLPGGKQISDTWVQGIGSLKGFLFPIQKTLQQLTDYDYLLSCVVYRDSGAEASNWIMNNLSDCYRCLGSIEESEQSKSLIYPVPAVDKLYLDKIPNIQSYTIYDINGKKVSETNYQKEFADISELTAGIYRIRIVTINNKNSVHSFVKSGNP